MNDIEARLRKIESRQERFSERLRWIVAKFTGTAMAVKVAKPTSAPVGPTVGKPTPGKPAVTPVGAEFADPEYQRKLAQVQRDFAHIFGDGEPCEEMRIVQPDGSEIPVRRKGRGFFV